MNDKSLIEVNIKEIKIDSNTPYGKPRIDLLTIYRYFKLKQMIIDFMYAKK